MTFAVIRGNPPSKLVACDGKLWEERHGPTEWPPEAESVGRIEEIWFYLLDEHGKLEDPIKIYNTSKRPSTSGSWAFRFVVELDDIAEGD